MLLVDVLSVRVNPFLLHWGSSVKQEGPGNVMPTSTDLSSCLDFVISLSIVLCPISNLTHNLSIRSQPLEESLVHIPRHSVQLSVQGRRPELQRVDVEANGCDAAVGIFDAEFFIKTILQLLIDVGDVGVLEDLVPGISEVLGHHFLLLLVLVDHLPLTLGLVPAQQAFHHFTECG